MDRALRFLGPRARSKGDVEARLERAGYSQSAIVQVVERLEELSILDDVAYARDAAEQGRASGKGADLVRRDLSLRKVAPETREAAVVEEYGQSDPQELAFRAGCARAGKLAGLPPAVQYRRLAGYLARRGHEPEVVTDVCCRILGDSARSD